ncbi:MAG TPA: site-2 protease family protein [Thermomicrobiaceae bacterium]|nr:site-2 protease family protein [Thermomicrobiaceae bacterium]
MSEQAVVIGNVAIPKRRFTRRRGLRGLLTYLPFGVVGLAAGRFGQPYLDGQLLLLTFPITIFLAVAIHELGHLAAARTQGFTIYVFAVGPLCLARRDGRWRLSRGAGKGIGGFVVSAPRHAHDYRRRRAVVVVAGAVANITVGLVLVLVARDVRFLLTLAEVSLLTGLVQAVPFSYGGSPSDGRTFLRLLRGGRRGALYELVGEINCRVLAGERPREWDRALIHAMTAIPTELHPDPAAFSYAYLHYFDAGDLQSAERNLERAVEVALARAPASAASCVASLAYFHAYRGEQIEACREALDLLRDFGLKPDVLQRLEAAVSLAAGEHEVGRAQAQAALDQLDKSWLPGLARADRDWLENLLAESEAADAATATSFRPTRAQTLAA